MAAKKLGNKTVILPKISGKGMRTASSASAVDKNNEIPTDRGVVGFNRDIRDLRTSDVLTAIREMRRQDGSFATAIAAYVEIAMSGYTITAYESQTHQFSDAGTQLARSVVASFDTLFDYTEGFSVRENVESTLKTALLESLLSGGIGLELVLDKTRLPDRLQVVDVRTIKAISEGDGTWYPRQEVSGQDPIDLDIPTFWMAFVHREAAQVYSRSTLEAALTASFTFSEYVQDVRRVVKRSGMDRMVVVLDSEKVVNSAPASIRRDAKKLREFMDSMRVTVENTLGAINPEDAIVCYDFAKPEYLQSGQGKQTDYTALMNTYAGLQASALKTPPSILGLRLEGGSQALGNIESLIFLKIATAIQTPVEQVMSRALTLACRLYGEDVYVEFQFDPINLRPADELAAFRTMQQTDILRKLSLGFISDEEAAHMLGTGPRPPGAPPLSGTMFPVDGGGTAPPAQGDTPMGRTLQADKKIPRAAGGSDNEQR